MTAHGWKSLVGALIAALLVAGDLPAEETPLPPRPTMSDERPQPGKLVRRVAPEYQGTQVFHALYLPRNYQPGRRYPVLVEFAPNESRAHGTTGRVEDCRLGYYLSGGRDALWIILPYVNAEERKNQTTWWGDADATVDYALKNLARECDEFGGERESLVLLGFSRGAIACGYLGLRNDEIADVWLGFWAHSHIDGGRFTPSGALERANRLRRRATLVTWGETDGARIDSPAGAARLADLGHPATPFEIPATGHTDRWIEQECEARRKARGWLDELLKTRPGTTTVRGQIVDATGQPIAGCRLHCGNWHRAVSDDQGRFALRGLTVGVRTLKLIHEGRALNGEPREVTLEPAHLAPGLDLGTIVAR